MNSCSTFEKVCSCIAARLLKKFVHVCLYKNELNSSPSLCLTFKRAKLKHNSMFVNKLVSMRLD